MVQPVRSRYDAESSEFSAFIQPLRRWFWYILGFVILATAVATYIGASKEPVYTASVQIVLEPRDGSSAINDLVADGLSKDASAIETQIKLLRTHSHIQNVITALALEERWAHKVSGDEDDEDKSGWSSLVDVDALEEGVNGTLRSWGIALINLAVGETSESSSPINEEPAAPVRNGRADDLDSAKLDALYRLFSQNYRVQQEGQSYVISIYYTSEDPYEAAEIANRSADVFIETKTSEKLGVTGRTSDWLSKRAQTLYDELQELNSEISAFRETNPVDVRQAPRADSEVAVLTTELAGVRGRLSAKNATLTLARETQSGEGDLRGIAEINTSITLQNLLAEQSSLLAQGGELSKTYGDKHPLMVQFEAEKIRLSSKIRQETARIVASIENDVRILEAQRDSLDQEIKGLRRQEVGKSKAKFQLEDLLRRADEKRELYQKALQRSKEIGEQ
ncbi:MAG: GumC family protein, partial [Geminicoccaceae bacterium]